MLTSTPTPAKPFKSYSELTGLLFARGMTIADEDSALRKLAQIGYYRLSGYWYIFRKIALDPQGNIVPSPLNAHSQRHRTKSAASKPNIIPLRTDEFIEGASFDDVISLYLFDKKLRLAMLDALERIEIYIRSIIAHEMGQYDPMAYEDDQYIAQKFLVTSPGSQDSLWGKWKTEHVAHLERSHEDCIIWHRIVNRQIPFWVAIETWDFGLLSKYFSYLDYQYQNRITVRIDTNLRPKILANWLQQLNILRNRCAHHTRIWNQTTGDKMLAASGIPTMQQLQLSETARRRQCGLIAVIWFILRRMNSTSDWLSRVRALIEPQVARHPFFARAMGFTDETLPELAKIEQLL